MIRIGSVVAGYRIDGFVGRGATATVYAATDLGAARRVALKVLATHLRDNAAVRDRFREAALLQRSLRHRNVLEVEDVVESGGELLIVTPLVGGGTLAEAVADGTLGGSRALAVLQQVADALDFAHGAGVVHGDIKPRNVLLDDGDTAYLADFGLAAAVSRVAPAAAASPGTIDYSAPERLRGEGPTRSADVYSLACMLFECVTGAVPYAHDTAAAVVGGHLYNAPPRPSDTWPDVPPELDEVLAAGLAKDPAARPGSARELVDAAAAVLVQLPPRVLPTSTRLEEARAARPLDDTLDEPLIGLPLPPEIEVEEVAALSRGFLVLAALALVAAAAAGAWLGQRSPAADAEERFAGGGRLVFDVPAGWTPSRPPEVPGLVLERPAALAPTGQARRVMFVAGSARTGPPTFLPRRLLERLARPARRRLVRLDGGVAYRYVRPVPVGFGGALTVFVLPGAGSSAVAACTSPRVAEPLLRECEGLARTLRVGRGVVYDPTPSRPFAAAYNAAVRVLRVARSSGLELLRKAASRRAQARAATEIAVAYRTTAASIRRTRPTPIARATTERFVTALDRAGVGYTRLAGSARRGDERAYAAARRLILDAEADLRAARSDLVGLGYAG